MPATHQPRHRRLTVPVVLYAHPFELGIAAAFVILGIRGLILDATSPSVDGLPELPLLMYRLGSIIAGAGIIAGLLVRHRPRGRALERAACYFLASVLAAFALLLMSGNGWDGFAVGLVLVVLAAAFLLRARAIRKAERVILEQLRAANTIPVPELLKIVDGRPPREEDEGRA